jgi:hypothetical protein
MDPVNDLYRRKIIRESIFPGILQRSPCVSLKSTHDPGFALRPLCFSEINPQSMILQLGPKFEKY